MLAFTGAYLFVEIPFSVYLVNVLGGMPSNEDIADVEFFGRILTAIAVVIAWVGMRVFPKYQYDFEFLSALRHATISGVLVGLFSFYALDLIADNLDSVTSLDMKREAYLVSIPRQTLHDTPSFSEISETPEFSAMKSLLASFVSADHILSAIGRDNASTSIDFASVLLGGEREFREQTLGAMGEFLNEAYAGYVEVNSAAKNELAKGLGKASEEYRSMVKDVKERMWRDNYGYKLPSRGSRYEMGVIKAVKRELPVYDNWHPRDQRGFVQAYLEKYYEEVLSQAGHEFAGNASFFLGDVFPVDLSRDQFARLKSVQDHFRVKLLERLDRIEGNVPDMMLILPTMSDAAFKSTVYDPIHEAISGRRQYAPQVAAYEFQFFAGDMKPYVQASWIPVMAIILSVSGAALHIFKFSGYAWTAVRGQSHRRGRYVFASFVLVGAFAAMALPGNEVTRSAAFKDMKSKSPVIGTFAEGLISIQPGFRIVGEVMSFNPVWGYVRSTLPDRREPYRFASGSSADTGSATAMSTVASSLTAPGIPLRKPGTVPVPMAKPTTDNGLRIAPR
ncbi:hypothetical protein [Roseibium sp. RKSG952]|uniref:hypothetical protein n=1 Tax=Roseibium sp. RKSG952 TaxID=2529384 RepID=UPI0012BBCF53|nr:hypothetical protein [Roseibium sp. RKSG952]MTH95021.1 hypothetical protein [Roseibium sp. RKSG952]